MNNQSSSSTTLVLIATAVAAYVGYEIHRSVQKHGWEGTIRLVWEGDPYDSDLRDAVDKLEDAEFDFRATHRIDDRLKGLEESLDSATAAVSSSAELWNEAWMVHPANRSGSSNNNNSRGANDNPLIVERTLADISSRLDKIASRVDGVILSSALNSSSSLLVRRVKERKKKLSMAIVSDMERCDALLSSYQVLQEQAN